MHPLALVRIKRIDSRFIKDAMCFLIGFDDDFEGADFPLRSHEPPEKETADEREPASGVKGDWHYSVGVSGACVALSSPRPSMKASATSSSPSS